MLYPENLKADEYIRIVCLRKGADTPFQKSLFVKNYIEFEAAVAKYKYSYDVYTQLATNRDNIKGLKENQRQRKVLYLDFDFQDYPDLANKDITSFSAKIKDKFPSLFICCGVASGNGYHFYISIKPSCNIKSITELNYQLAELVGADLAACKSTQIVRVPTSYNHKVEKGIYDYVNKDKWKYTKVVFNDYKKNELFKAYTLDNIDTYIQKYISNEKAKFEFAEYKTKVTWNYADKSTPQCYLCIKKVFYEGADIHQRNFWLGRIVKMYQKQGVSEPRIYKLAHEYNSRCRPPKPTSVIDDDVKRYLHTDYNLLGCWESIKNQTQRNFVQSQCDKAFCQNYHTGTTLTIDAKLSKLPCNVLTDTILRKLSGNEYMILTLLDMYSESFGRRGFRVKNLKKLLKPRYIDKPCISSKTLKKVLENLERNKWIILKPDVKSNLYDDIHIKQSRKLKEYTGGYILFYFSVCCALIDRRISQTAYKIYLTLIRNLTNNKSVTYKELTDDLQIDKGNISKYIGELADAKCILVQKKISELGKEYNKYQIIDPDIFKDDKSFLDTGENIKISLLA